MHAKKVSAHEAKTRTPTPLSSAEIDSTIKTLLALRKNNTLKGLSIRAMKEEGRRH